MFWTSSRVFKRFLINFSWVLRCLEMSWDVLRCLEMSWDVLRCLEMSWDVLRCLEMSWVLLSLPLKVGSGFQSWSRWQRSRVSANANRFRSLQHAWESEEIMDIAPGFAEILFILTRKADSLEQDLYHSRSVNRTAIPMSWRMSCWMLEASICSCKVFTSDFITHNFLIIS